MKTLKCASCDKRLIMAKTKFEYLGHEVEHEVPRCPKCGQVFIPEELAQGRIREVEELFEEK